MRVQLSTVLLLLSMVVACGDDSKKEPPSTNNGPNNPNNGSNNTTNNATTVQTTNNSTNGQTNGQNTNQNSNGNSNQNTSGSTCEVGCEFEGDWKSLMGSLTSTAQMWGCSENEIWIAGTNLTRFNGVGLRASPDSLEQSVGYRDVHGNACDNVWFIGSSNLVYQWDGTQMNQITVPFTNAELFSVWVSSSNEVFIAGRDVNQPRLYKYDGSWSTIDLPQGMNNIRLPDRADELYLISADKLYLPNGDDWREVDLPGETSGTTSEYDGTYWVVGGTGLYAYDGSDWTTWPAPLNRVMRTLAIAADGTVWAASTQNLLQFNGFELTDVADMPSTPFGGPTGAVIIALWPGDENKVRAIRHEDNFFINAFSEFDIDSGMWRDVAHEPISLQLFDDGEAPIIRSMRTAWRVGDGGATPLAVNQPWEDYFDFSGLADGFGGKVWLAGFGGLSIADENGILETITSTDPDFRSLSAANEDSAWAIRDAANEFVQIGNEGVSDGVAIPNIKLLTIWAAEIDDLFIIGLDDALNRKLFRFLGNVSVAATELDPPVASPELVEGTSHNDVWVVGGDEAARFDGTVWTAHPLPGVATDLTVSAGVVAVLLDDGSVLLFENGVWSPLDTPTAIDSVSEVQSAENTLWAMTESLVLWELKLN